MNQEDFRMNLELISFETGWAGISLVLSIEEIDKFRELLLLLKTGQLNHFHLRRNDWDSGPSIADIEIGIAKPDVPNNMQF